jgi:hypothetical protein
MVEGVRKETKKQTIVILLIFLLIISIYVIPQVIAPSTKPIIESKTISYLQQNIFENMNHSILTPHLLIFISPQYQMDVHIQESIHNYQQAVYHQPGWSSQVIKLNNETNQVATIDKIIEESALQYNLSAVLLIGEDIALPIKTTYQNIQKPQLNLYSTINTSENDEKTICVSILYPNPTVSYQQKQTQLVSTINRFAQKRTLFLNGNISIIEQSTLAHYSQNDYTNLSKTMNAHYQQDCTPEQLSSLMQTPHDIICLHGHGQPHQVILNSTSKLKISSDIASYLPTSILAIDGCYTDSLFIDQDNFHTPFISSICTSSTIHIGFFGLLSQQTLTEQDNVINSILSKITPNNTIAEMINQANVGFDFVFSGDPTVVFDY